MHRSPPSLLSMGRALFPPHAQVLIHHFLPLPLLLACIALTTITLVAALCASHNRKSSRRPSDSEKEQRRQGNKADKATVATSHGQPTPRWNPFGIRARMKERAAKAATATATAAAAEEEEVEEEGSVWKKTIILGEKCRVPENEEEDEEEMVFYDESGRRKRNYHPRTPRSTPVSRTNSSIDAKAIPAPSGDLRCVSVSGGFFAETNPDGLFGAEGAAAG
ncbi:hypothetical protein HPP92_007654 [Vanilla planifolia]|uniref:Uncharacterized protein n=1 Tax=Vanilla planifolia TaxID=51239 RepID=A0A835V8X4_VANPL|nr:hypothetical protein HPP92_007654 [Vanilla planifolia]